MSRRLIRFLAAMLVVGTCVSSAAWWLWRDLWQAMNQPLALPSPVIFELKPGTPFAALARDFVARGWMPNPLYLQFAAWRAGFSRRLQAGAYEVLAGDTPLILLRKIANGEVKVYQLTVAEGLRFSEILQRLQAAPGIAPGSTAEPPDALFTRAAGKELAAEGWFFPDTWRYHHNTPVPDLLSKGYRKMRALLETEWAERAPSTPLQTPYDALILASIVEKETAVAEERPAIAGVFLRRLQKGMRLQTDPTVIYGLGERFNGDLTRADLQRDTPYNTYTRHGLPPTPICSPGLASLHAVLHPADGDALYFVARGDGTHVFSSTLAAHNAAVKQFQQSHTAP